MSRSKRNKFAGAIATLALPVTTATLTGHANAVCTPAAPVDNTTVTCTGTTSNQNDPNGYGTGSENGLTINIGPGASVTGTNAGINLSDGFSSGINTINNFGTISGADRGIVAFGLTLNNANVVSANITGVQTFGFGFITNSGTISGITTGIENQNGTVTNTSTGTISGGTTGVIMRDAGQTSDTARVENDGTITGGEKGIFFVAQTNKAIGDVINRGTISATAADGAGILFNTLQSTVTNSGTIAASGFGATAVNAKGDVNVTNNSAGAISGRFIGVQAGGAATVNNAQDALIEATEPSFNAVAIFGSAVSVQNSGKILSLGGSGSGIGGGDGGVTVSNTSTGVISATRAAIFSRGNLSVTGNEGLIESNSSTSFAIVGQNDVDVVNGSGTIRAFGNNSLAIVGSRTATVANGSGLIQTTDQDSFTIFGANVKVTGNSGTIEATGVNGIAIGARQTADVTNSNTIQSTGGNGVAIRAPNALIKNNAGGTILGNSGAIEMDTGTIDNAGTLSSTKIGSVSTVRAAISATVNNGGTILGPDTGFAILSPSGRLDIVNSGTIIGDGTGIGIEAAIVNVTNTGTIDTGSHGIVGKTGTVENFGTISTTAGGSGIKLDAGSVANVGTIQATASGVEVDNGTISNSGLISGESGVHPFTFAMINNSGTIQGIGSTGFGVLADNSATVFNTGAISGNIGIQADGRNNVGTAITNAGTIAGTGGTAIKLSPAADTLTLLPGSKIIGVVDMGGGADTINVFGFSAVTSRVSSLFKVLTASLPDLINFTGIINTINSIVTPNGMPTVQSGDSIATLDPTAFGQADRALMNFTGGVSSLVRGRLGGTAANNSAVQVVSFAPTGASGRTNEAFAAISTIGYAAERSRPLAHPFTYADAPYNVWTSGFGGTSTQKGDSTMLRSVASAGAGVIGVDRQVRPDLLMGAFAGGGAGRLSVELNSQSVDTDYVTGGVYGRFDWVSHFLDFTLQGGATVNKSKRLVLNDSVAGGSETATASYDGWYISPEVAYGRRYHFANGHTLTPVGRIRYLAGTFDGYDEAGSAQNLAVGRRTLHDLEERAEVELSKITGVGVGSFSTSVHGGLIALQRLGNPTINTVLIGQDLSFTTPGKASTAGVVAGVGFDFRATDRMSLFGAFEATLMSDHTRTAAAKAGLKVAF